MGVLKFKRKFRHLKVKPVPFEINRTIDSSSHQRSTFTLSRSPSFEQQLLASSCLSVPLCVRIEQLGSHCTDFHEIWYLSIFLKSVQKIQVSLNWTRITGTLHEDQYTFMIISRSILLRIRKFSDKSCRDNRNTLFLIPFLRKSCRLWECGDSIVEPGRPQMKIWRMRTAWWILKATDTHSPQIC